MKLWVTVMLALGACDSADHAATVPVTVRFVVRANGEDVRCGQTYAGLGATLATFEPADLRLYVHDVALVDDAGRAVAMTLDEDARWQGQGVALLDFEDGTGACENGNADLHTVVTGTVPDGDYRGLHFVLGVPPALDHLDTATAAPPLDVSSMFWGWIQGYKFLRIDGLTAAGGWSVHLGALDCSRDDKGAFACATANAVSVDLSLDPTRDVVVLDLGALFAESQLDANSGPSVGCMSDRSDPDCVAIFARLGLPLGEVPASEQRVFTTAVAP